MQNNKLIIPAAIIVAGALIGGAIIYTQSAPAKTPAKTAATPRTVSIKPVTSTDHILGNPDAKVVVVEYSDMECPFCKTFHATIGKIMETYAKDGSVAWVYRHFAIASLHPKAPKEAEATECVNQIAGNDVFWKYLNRIYQVTPSNNGLDAAQLPILAAEFGVDKKTVQTCLDNNTFTEKVQSDYNDAIAAGGQGTPFTILVPKTQLRNDTIKQINEMFSIAAAQYQMEPDQLGFVTPDKKVVLNGNLPYQLVQQIIAAIIA